MVINGNYNKVCFSQSCPCGQIQVFLHSFNFQLVSWPDISFSFSFLLFLLCSTLCCLARDSESKVTLERGVWLSNCWQLLQGGKIVQKYNYTFGLFCVEFFFLESRKTKEIERHPKLWGHFCSVWKPFDELHCRSVCGAWSTTARCAQVSLEEEWRTNVDIPP